ncbi:unnamed protein product [Heligmosomoides polygyrus]|uniref:60S ribosomal protein L29 n=1 Tax=Heligmosomoides polygyrus TaxID=6339 RepID=A0A183F2A8_HELPZ|nr:unnamed protein product [Heligmosomoides polygyrus]
MRNAEEELADRPRALQRSHAFLPAVCHRRKSCWEDRISGDRTKADAATVVVVVGRWIELRVRMSPYGRHERNRIPGRGGRELLTGQVIVQQHDQNHQNRKAHRNGIKKPKKQRFMSMQEVDQKFLKNLRFAKKNNKRHVKIGSSA